MEEHTISLKDFYVELLCAVRVCLEGEAHLSDDAIIFTALNGQQFRITAELTAYHI